MAQALHKIIAIAAALFAFHMTETFCRWLAVYRQGTIELSSMYGLAVMTALGAFLAVDLLFEGRIYGIPRVIKPIAIFDFFAMAAFIIQM